MKRYTRHPAHKQVALLAAFQEAGWASSVVMPGGAKESFRATIRDLNHVLVVDSPIRFRPNGTGRGVTWEFTSPEN